MLKSGNSPDDLNELLQDSKSNTIRLEKAIKEEI